jgi:hypothetical protein
MGMQMFWNPDREEFEPRDVGEFLTALDGKTKEQRDRYYRAQARGAAMEASLNQQVARYWAVFRRRN